MVGKQINMNTQQKYELVKRAAQLDKLRETTDSKTEAEKYREEVHSMRDNLKKINGTLVKTEGKLGRIWHSYYGVFKVTFSDRYSYTWSNNYKALNPENFEIIEEDNTALIEEIEEIDGEIYQLNKKIEELNQKKNQKLKDFVPFVNPESLEKTEEINRSAFSFGGDPVYYSEGFCELTGIKVRS